MTYRTLSIATIYSSAQCVLSVVGSIGVILLFAGIPQLIYSPVVSAANLITFIMGAVLIMTMVIGNSILNYRYRMLTRDAARQDGGQGEGGGGSANRVESGEDKPPTYESVLTLDGSPPEYASIASQKPPRYEEITKETYNALDATTETTMSHTNEVPPMTPQETFQEYMIDDVTRGVILTRNMSEEDVEFEIGGAEGNSSRLDDCNSNERSVETFDYNRSMRNQQSEITLRQEHYENDVEIQIAEAEISSRLGDGNAKQECRRGRGNSNMQVRNLNSVVTRRGIDEEDVQRDSSMKSQTNDGNVEPIIQSLHNEAQKQHRKNEVVVGASSCSPNESET